MYYYSQYYILPYMQQIGRCYQFLNLTTRNFSKPQNLWFIILNGLKSSAGYNGLRTVYKYEIDRGTHCVFVLCVLVQGSNHNNTSFQIPLQPFPGTTSVAFRLAASSNFNVASSKQVWIFCLKFSLNPFRFSLTREETDSKNKQCQKLSNC